MNRLVLLLFLLGSLFIFIGILSSPKIPVQTAREVKSSKETPVQTPTSIQSSNQLSQALIIRVVDGDTVDIQVDNKKDVVRLIGINAPETKECFGKEATDKALALLSSKLVNLEADPTQDDRDKYHRLLRYVFIDGANFDELMVREGFAKEYTYHIPYKYQSEFKEAQKEAQDNKKGLWGLCK